ncbi:MAG: adenylate/guanylate cyclase domain-containing protein [Syntrophorhabdales bacterium]|jgi:adenylate cyclase
MAPQALKRKLTAILSADVKGYSRLMSEDEEATVRTLNARKEMLTTLIKRHQGRVVDAPGDNLLAEFASVVDAVRCAVEIQNELKAQNEELPEKRRMEFRIGINLGDVIEQEGKIFGDGVNVAARLEQLSEAGGVCISGTAYDQVKNKLSFGYASLGEQTVKNIAEPVRAYRVKMESGPSGPEREGSPDMSEAPSIAVLPFVNMSGDPTQEYFSDGITEEIITGLSKVPRLIVIARNSTFVYKGKPVKVQEVGRELGVRYVLEGSVQRAGDRVRITAQLIDAATGHHLWAQRYERDMKDIFALQDEITLKILMAMQVKLTEGEQALMPAGKGSRNLEFYLKLLEGTSYAHRFNIEGNILARRMAEEAIALSPDDPDGYAMLAWTHVMDYWFGSAKSPHESIEKAFDLAQKSLGLDDTHARTHGLMSQIYSIRREHDKAVAEGERAVALDPGGADVHAWLGQSLNFADRAEEAIPLFEKAIRLNPFGPGWYFSTFATSYQLTGQFGKAVTLLKKALRLAPDHIMARLFLAVAHSSLGRDEEARAEAEEVLRINPRFSLESYAKLLPFKNQAYSERIIEALRKAGLK